MVIQTEINTTLNGVCPYFTMFPLDFPYTILKDKASPGDEVIDPFCGRGTTNFASRLLGLTSYGLDASPVAVAISEAKLASTTPEEILDAVDSILNDVEKPTDLPDGEFWKLAYHPDVLEIVCRIREGLLHDCTTDARKALRAIMLGGLHGPRNKRAQSYFSNQSQRTFAPKPRYAIKWWKAHNLVPEKVDVLKIIETRARRYYSGYIPATSGEILKGDSRSGELCSQLPGKKNIKWVITSPPYYGMNTYIADQWLRHWFVGGPSDVDYSTKGQIEHSSPEVFTTDLKGVWKNMAGVCSNAAQMIVRFGAIHDRKADGLTIIKNSIKDSGWSIVKVEPAGSASRGKRQAVYFLPKSKNALEEYDIWTILDSD